jgi:hypothetical protein
LVLSQGTILEVADRRHLVSQRKSTGPCHQTRRCCESRTRIPTSGPRLWVESLLDVVDGCILFYGRSYRRRS